MCTHEQFVHAVAAAALTFAETQSNVDAQQIAKLRTVKMVYGRGAHGLRGQTVYNAWKHQHACEEHPATDLIEICALGEESWIQLAGTTIHELGHALAGWGAGHSKEWKHACALLGLRRVHAAGTHYLLANFDPRMRQQLALMPKPSDGNPHNGLSGAIRHTKAGTARVCTAGIGTKGGKSRGTGSGARVLKYVCAHGQIIRASTDDLKATCDVCGGRFEQPEETLPADPLTAALLSMVARPA